MFISSTILFMQKYFFCSRRSGDPHSGVQDLGAVPAIMTGGRKQTTLVAKVLEAGGDR
jgi:hypothetical protein